MTTFLTYTVLGVVIGCIYAMSASGLVVTYTTSGVFNFAHGAIGMVAAFSFWQLTVGWGWPTVPALLFILLVGAPLFGAIIERVLVRQLENAPLEVNLVVTVGLLVFLIGIASLIWNPTRTTRTLPRFFAGHRVRLFHVFIDYHELIVVLFAVAVAVGWLAFSLTRTGIAMRAVVDNRDLTEMTGASPTRVSQYSWALGASLAALAGILLAPLQYLDINILTLVIINAFAAAMVGRLKSLPQTILGALIIGLSITYGVGYLPIGGFLSKVQGAIPMIVLFVVLILMRQERLRTGRAIGMLLPRVPGLRQSLWAAGVFVVIAALASGFLTPVNLSTATRAMVFGLVMLSLVLLTGYGGQVSLCQMTFVGLGAFAMGHLGHGGNPVGIVLAVVFAAACGAAVALPTLRLRGLYLALATLAFGQAMDTIFFGQSFGSYGGALNVARLHIPGLPTTSDRSFFILTAVAFALCAVGTLAVRRGRFGRQLAALNDSPAACATLGANVNTVKLAVFAASAGVAGLAGALYGGMQHLVTQDDFMLFQSLIVLLVLLVGGRNTAVGALIGGLALASFPTLAHHYPSLSHLQYVLVGLGAITIGRNPNGLGGQLSTAGQAIRARSGALEPATA